MKRSRVSQALVIAVLFTLGVSGTIVAYAAFRSTDSATAEPPLPREELERFVDYPVLWVGEEFDGETLDLIKRRQSPPTLTAPAIDTLTLVYGACDGAAAQAGCQNALQITIDRPCGPVLVEGAKRTTRLVRGMPIIVKTDSSLRIESAAFTASVFVGTGTAAEREATGIRVIEELRGVNALAGAISITSPLSALAVPARPCGS